MIAFLIFLQLRWNGAARRSDGAWLIVRSHKSEFAAGFVLTELAALVVFLPPAILFAFSDLTETQLSDGAWFATIIYCGFAWSFMLLLEQLFAAELYLWDMKWRDACSSAEARNETLPSLRDVRRPSILDGIDDLAIS